MWRWGCHPREMHVDRVHDQGGGGGEGLMCHPREMGERSRAPMILQNRIKARERKGMISYPRDYA